MTATVRQIESGLAAYLDKELIPKLPGWKKWLTGTVVSMYLEQGEQIYESIKDKEFVKAMGIIEDGEIDIDKIYRHLLEQARKENAVIELPVVGTITLKADDVERMYECIRQS